ncbi:MAG: hypothetical protein ACYCOU_04340 [Sulfobacillus sp.]
MAEVPHEDLAGTYLHYFGALPPPGLDLVDVLEKRIGFSPDYIPQKKDALARVHLGRMSRYYRLADRRQIEKSLKDPEWVAKAKARYLEKIDDSYW